MNKSSKEQSIQGVPVSEGIAIGRLHLLSVEEFSFPHFSINSHEVDREIQRYRKALSSSRRDLEQLQGVLSKEGSDEATTIIDSHIQMLEDPLITTIVEEKIHQMLQNTESVFRSVIGEYEKKFISINDVFFQQRWIDVKDLSQRILKHLYPKTEEIVEVPSNAILFSEELTPSHAAEACISKVGAFVSELGGKTSHSALIARAKGIPYVANINRKDLASAEGSLIIVDGICGKIILNPTNQTLQSYCVLRQELLEKDKKLLADMEIESTTQDQKKIHVLANIDKLTDLDHLSFKGAEGVGLFRSEFLFLQREIFSITEQEQYLFYVEMVRRAKQLPITFRVFDFGSDKGLFYNSAIEEPNPALGCRAIRFLLQYRDFFKKQLRAILRASIEGEVSLLLPLIADVEELKQAKAVIEEVKRELFQEGISFAFELPIGCMIEVPSAAMTCDLLAKECDFFSIGTNDLVQYTLAIDRAHPTLGHFYKPAHPSILRMLKYVIDIAKKTNKKLSICGEMASNPLFTTLLIGLGIESFSCAPRHLPLIKKAIRCTSYQKAQEFVDQIFQLESASEIEELLEDHYTKHILDS